MLQLPEPRPGCRRRITFQFLLGCFFKLAARICENAQICFQFLLGCFVEVQRRCRATQRRCFQFLLGCFDICSDANPVYLQILSIPSRMLPKWLAKSKRRVVKNFQFLLGCFNSGLPSAYEGNNLSIPSRMLQIPDSANAILLTSYLSIPSRMLLFCNWRLNPV